MFTICFLCCRNRIKESDEEAEMENVENVLMFSTVVCNTHNTSSAFACAFPVLCLGKAENERKEKSEKKFSFEKIIINYSYHTIQ